MRRSAVVYCQDPPSLHAVKLVLGTLNIDAVPCTSQEAAIEAMLGGDCSVLLADFDLAGATDVARIASLLTPPLKPMLLAMTSAWPCNGGAVLSGINRVLYKPLHPEQLKEALQGTREHGNKKKSESRKAPRFEIKTAVYLEFDRGSLPAIGLNISEHGFAVRATERVPQRANMPFHCLLPGTNQVLEGRADVIWADADGRAGLFFSHLAPAARRRLRHWLRKHAQEKGTVRALLPPATASVGVAASK